LVESKQEFSRETQSSAAWEMVVGEPVQRPLPDSFDQQDTDDADSLLDRDLSIGLQKLY
jgi:hypothetical protein